MMFEQVRDAISVERLKSYLQACGGDLAPALELYRWNHDVAGTLLRPLCDLEVTLRNALVRQLERTSDPEPWWKLPVLTADIKAGRDLDRALQSLIRAGKPVTAGGIVAEMSFGFWVSLIGTRFDMSLWRRGLYRAFRTTGVHASRCTSTSSAC